MVRVDLTNSNRIHTCLTSGYVLEVLQNSSSPGRQRSVVARALDDDQEEFQTFVFTEVPGQECFTIGNTVTQSVLELVGSLDKSGRRPVIASTPRPDDQSQQWEFITGTKGNASLVNCIDFAFLILITLSLPA